jgi:hypothetical protein
MLAIPGIVAFTGKIAVENREKMEQPEVFRIDRR